MLIWLWMLTSSSMLLVVVLLYKSMFFVEIAKLQVFDWSESLTQILDKRDYFYLIRLCTACTISTLSPADQKHSKCHSAKYKFI